MTLKSGYLYVLASIPHNDPGAVRGQPLQRFAKSAELSRQAEMAVVEPFRCRNEHGEHKKKNSFFDVRSRNVVENKPSRYIAEASLPTQVLWV
jgi:hypothetical protein